MRILVTGSTDGIGLKTAQELQQLGHDVVFHARSEERGQQIQGRPEVLVADFGDLEQVRAMGRSAGAFDVVVHNAGIGGQAERAETKDGIERTFQVNVLAPYILTALMPRPQRLVYLTSGLESVGVANLADLQYKSRVWNGMQCYSDSKLHDVALAFAVARRWPEVYSNAVDPGWIRTKLGGPNATDDLPEGAETQVWLATADGDALVTGKYFKRKTELTPNPAAHDVEFQDGLLRACAELTGVTL
ncbi:SDR family NAD(P)-dependent oxidoreductase [Dactylosporangium vinaceum]|uniref:SDR family NAD(P)-dependent oxidoreductase n=1 Tax=Dactylosporangium vinaceum TaxID=53362 RepID=A0ABV5M794_9ACTN|nr:SDR family NAD(P)-dependent oxidoreductase [Dactylosporangium vinaceum]UAC00582.1 SDR family NAD(P)-dependent oxidoreductase [Dactylosporangium vinaceum]